MGVQLVKVGQSEGEKGFMQVIDGAGKKKSIVITCPDNRKVWRIAFQIGENAWGSLGGSMDASIDVTSIRKITKNQNKRRPSRKRRKGNTDRITRTRSRKSKNNGGMSFDFSSAMNIKKDITTNTGFYPLGDLTGITFTLKPETEVMR